MNKFISVFFLIFAFLLQSFFTTMPFVLTACLIIYVLERKVWILPVAFSMGLFLDIATMRPIGSTSLFFIVFLFVISLYQKKFEIFTFHFIFLASFFGTISFLLFFEPDHFILQTLLNSFLALLIFSVLKRFSVLDKEEKELKFYR